MSDLTRVDDLRIEEAEGLVRFAVRRIRDGQTVAIHRASHRGGEDANAILDAIEAMEPAFPAIPAQDRQAVVNAFAACPAPPPENVTLDDLKARRAAELEHRRDHELRRFVFNGASIPLNERIEGQLVYLFVALSRQTAGEAVDIEVRNGVYRTLDRAQIGAVMDAAFTHRQTCMANARAKTDQIAQAQSLEELAAIDLSTGWP